MAKNIYEVETKSYMLFDNKPSYIGQDISFIRANSKQEAKNIYTNKYSEGEMVKHYTGKKKVIYDLKNLKITKKPEYNKLIK